MPAKSYDVAGGLRDVDIVVCGIVASWLNIEGGAGVVDQQLEMCPAFACPPESSGAYIPAF